MRFFEIFAAAACAAVAAILAVLVLRLLWSLIWYAIYAIIDREPPERNNADELYQAMQKDDGYREYIKGVTESKIEMLEEQRAEGLETDVPATFEEEVLLSQKESEK